MRITFLVVLCAFIFFSLGSCTQKNSAVPTVGFVDAFEDRTIAQARKGFMDALKAEGFSEDDKTLQVYYKNAQGDIPTLTQIVHYFVSQKVDLIASNTTLATITAIQRSAGIPVFMMVAPEPEQMNVMDASGKAPAHLFGVAETLDYIDTSLALIPRFVKPKAGKLKVGMVYNQAEPQSLDALNRARAMALSLGFEIEARPINNSSEAQLVVLSLLNQKIDAFFANPDNVVFASFETLLKNCEAYGVPIFTSESGLVERGAVAAYGADIYQWGYQSGLEAARFLKQGKDPKGLGIETVRVRKWVYNRDVANKYGMSFPAPFEPLH